MEVYSVSNDAESICVIDTGCVQLSLIVDCPTSIIKPPGRPHTPSLCRKDGREI